MKITSNDVIKVYNRLVASSRQLYKLRKYEKCLHSITAASAWMYSFNITYNDTELESLIHEVADHNIKNIEIKSPQSDNVVFIDYFGFDNRGLTQQYLRGLMSLKKRILYILHNSSPNCCSEIIRELKEYGNCEINIFKTDNHNFFKTATEISKKILDFSPKDILIHMAPWDVVTLLALSSIYGSTKYNINLTDHAYWLGSSFVDYNIEFRGYGVQLSLQKRNLKKSQLINLPYYPIVSKYTSFQGFPSLPDDSLIVFCGGAEYKMLGKNGIFFSLMDTVLDISEQVYIFVAGINVNSVFAEGVSRMRNKSRVFMIGTRIDINEVFAHSDIYLSSYPFIGGLMTQYAACNRLPILAYGEPGDFSRAENLVNHFSDAMHTKESLDEFKEYARKLIEEKEFRKSEGESNYKAMMNEENFGKYLDVALTTHETDISFIPEQPRYEDRIKYYLEIENKTHEGLRTLVYQMRLRSFVIAPKYTLDIIKILTKFTINKIYRNILKLQTK